MNDRDFGAWLVKERLLQKDTLQRAMEMYQTTQARLDTVLLDLGVMSESALLKALGRFHNARTVSRAELSSIAAPVIRWVSPRIATRLRVIPFNLEGKTLSVATLDPTDLLVADELSLITGCLIVNYVTLEIRLYEALHIHYKIHLPAQYQSLIRRFDLKTSAADQTPRTAPKKASPATRSRPAPKPETAEEKVPRPGDRPKRREIYGEPLEVSAEDLALFPSLRGDAGATDAPPGPSTRTGLEPSAAGLGPKNDSAADSVAPQTGPPMVAEIVPPAADLSPEERLAATSVTLQNAEMREDIADAVLGFCAPLFRRRMMLVVRGDTIMGWRGEGEGVDPDRVRKIAIPVAEPSVFSGLIQGADFWLGPLPTMPRNSEVVAGLGGTPPTGCFVLPIRVREKTVCLLYFDNIGDGVAGLPMPDLRRLGSKAGLAFQVYLLKSKIRNM
jgi:hypothetical protein